jgi:phosphatidylglycerophosphatase A
MLSKLIASGFGSGYSPKAPGTAGSVAASLVWYFFIPSSGVSINYQIVSTVCVCVLGTIATARSIKNGQDKDPQWIVIDEWAGIFISSIGALSIQQCVIAFLFFRLFDITKPWLVGKAERLPGAYGIMADDIVAGVFSLISCRILCVASGKWDF